MKKKEEGAEDANQTKEQIKDEKVLFSQNLRGRGRGRGGRDSGRSGRGSNFDRGQSIQQNWRGRGRGQRDGRSNYSNFECYKCGKYGHYAKDCNSFKCYNCDKVGHLAKDCRIEKKVEETTNLTLEAEANEGFLLMAQNEINTNDNVWYLDSGASNHMCGHKHLFKEMRKIEDGNVSFGDASKVKVEGKGTIRYLQKDGLIGSIQDVYYVPNLKTNILSLGQLTEKGYSILMKERILYLKDKLGHLIARVEMERNRMYKLNLINVREKCLQVNVEDKASLWHLRFGHLHHAGLRRVMFYLWENPPSRGILQRECIASIFSRDKKKSHEEGVAVVAEMTSYTDKVVKVLQQEKESQEKERAAYGGQLADLEKIPIISYPEELERHLNRTSFIESYWAWTYNEEQLTSNVPETANMHAPSSQSHMQYDGQFNMIHEMVGDAFDMNVTYNEPENFDGEELSNEEAQRFYQLEELSSNVPETANMHAPSSRSHLEYDEQFNLIDEMVSDAFEVNVTYDKPEDFDGEELSNEEAQRFYQLLKEMNTSLFGGSSDPNYQSV
ncbi:hypothetical protein KIW84_015608 [Lathyrus oleraceus]|uniref:CCHC-type domain-containing protein n=1 Tax=Pisum sativum TaxID=3888 RepID=A0A9D5H0W9_PEA|nr:hypothetical protein KIW84_015608 [Pisum sativum]